MLLIEAKKLCFFATLYFAFFNLIWPTNDRNVPGMWTVQDQIGFFPFFDLFLHPGHKHHHTGPDYSQSGRILDL